MDNANTKWVCIFKTNRRFEAEAVRGNLESAEIPCILLNKQDSTYMAFGYVELHVPEENKEAAERILAQDADPNEN